MYDESPSLEDAQCLKQVNAYCRGVVIIAITLVGFVVAGRIGGNQYYAHVDEDETFAPYCHLIMYRYKEDGTEIGPGTNLVVDPDRLIANDPAQTSLLATGATVGISLQKVQQDGAYNALASMVNFNTSSSGLKKTNFMAEKCELQIVTVRSISATQDRVLIYNLATKEQLELPTSCGGKKPGEFLASNDNLVAGGGLSVAGIVFSLVVWCPLKLLAVWMGLLITEAVKTHGKCDQCMAGIGMFLFQSTLINFFISPLSNIETHEVCPQLITTFYSTSFQWAGPVIVLCGSACLCCVIIFGLRDRIDSNVYRFDQNDNPNPLDVCKMCVTIPLAGGLCFSCVGGVWYMAMKAWWCIFFGFEINFTFRFPSFALALECNLLRFMLMLLTVLELLEMLSTTFGKFMFAAGGY